MDEKKGTANMTNLTKLMDRKFAIINLMMRTPFVRKCPFCVKFGRGGNILVYVSKLFILDLF